MDLPVPFGVPLPFAAVALPLAVAAGAAGAA